ncbi:MAG: VCBS repeat-containing protein, partial [Anaerolineales bacterium]|nr:VCBS repeat-containing protein [Anaerolineales bacterium]
PELLLVDGQGQLTVFGAADDESWQPLATANLPAEAGPVVGLEIELRRQQESAAILTTGPDGAEKLYELFFNPPNQLLLRAQPGLHSPAEQRRLCLGRRFGPPGPGLLAVAAVESRDTRSLALRATPAFAQPITLPLTYRPVALTFTADTVWVADSRARIGCYALTGDTLTPAPAWPEAGVTVPGQVTDLTLWPDPAAPDEWLLLVATDDRYLLALDSAGQRRAQIYLPTALTALAPDSAAPWPRLLAVTEEGQLICLSPLRAGLVADPLPELLAVMALLPESEQVALLTRWAHGAPPEQAAAVAIWVARLCAGDPSAQVYLAGLAADPALTDPTATIGLVLAALEPYLLVAADSQQPAVSAFLELAAGWDALRSPTLQRILNRLTAQIAARFGAEFRDQPAYRRLSESRRDGELSRALSYRQQGLESDDPAAALNFYRASLNYLGRILLRRRQAVWTFATTAAIRAAAPLAGGQRALLATQAGLLHQLNLLERQQETLLSLPDGSMPRALASGPLESRSHSSVVVLTDTGELLLGHTGAPNGLMLSQQVTVNEDLRCLTIIPHTPDNPPRFLAGGHAGLIQLFAQSANGRWRESQSFRVKAEWISALRVTRLDEKQPPVILAGGSRAGQRGILYRLSLAGVQEQEPLYFPGIVRDIRTIAQLNTSERLVAVICDDGYLYVMKGNGARLWQYRIGHAARSFAIHDIDNNGQPEIIVGGEDNTLSILHVNGSVH